MTLLVRDGCDDADFYLNNQQLDWLVDGLQREISDTYEQLGSLAKLTGVEHRQNERFRLLQKVQQQEGLLQEMFAAQKKTD